MFARIRGALLRWDKGCVSVGRVYVDFAFLLENVVLKLCQIM